MDESHAFRFIFASRSIANKYAETINEIITEIHDCLQESLANTRLSNDGRPHLFPWVLCLVLIPSPLLLLVVPPRPLPILPQFHLLQTLRRNALSLTHAVRQLQDDVLLGGVLRRGRMGRQIRIIAHVSLPYRVFWSLSRLLIRSAMHPSSRDITIAKFRV
jgi:hypothetical protein